MSDVTCLLEAIRRGDPDAEEKLLQQVYVELRRLARARMAREQPCQTLQPTALVHEAWLRLGDGARFENRAHFFGAAGEAMRRILVESARRKKRGKYGGELERVDLGEVEIVQPMPDDDPLALDEALNGLARVDARAAEVVKLCFFVGLTQQEAPTSSAPRSAPWSGFGVSPVPGSFGRSSRHTKTWREMDLF